MNECGCHRVKLTTRIDIFDRASSKVVTILGSILAFSDTVEPEGRQMKQCPIRQRKEKSQKIHLKKFVGFRFGSVSSVEIKTKQDLDGNVLQTFAFVDLTASQPDITACINTLSNAK
jgi:hypothetical protein